MPLGLAASVVFHPETMGRLERAAGKLEERYVGGKTEEVSLLRRWSSAATEVVRALRHTDSRTYRQVIQRADEILREVQADAYAHLSDISLLGFDQRLARFGHRLAAIELVKGALEWVRNPAAVEELIAYLEKRRAYIPNYQQRQRAGLWIASTRVEKYNDWAVSARCKHQGMSWSPQGVLALAVLEAAAQR